MRCLQCSVDIFDRRLSEFAVLRDSRCSFRPILLTEVLPSAEWHTAGRFSAGLAIGDFIWFALEYPLLQVANVFVLVGQSLDR